MINMIEVGGVTIDDIREGVKVRNKKLSAGWWVIKHVYHTYVEVRNVNMAGIISFDELLSDYVVVDVDSGSGNSVAPPSHKCAVAGHEFVQTDLLKSWCKYCDVDAVWDKERCMFKAQYKKVGTASGLSGDTYGDDKRKLLKELPF